MTLSILALDRATGAIGGAAATGNLAVGAWVLRAAAGSGAVATQGHSVSPLWGDECLERLRRGERADAIVEAVSAADAGRHLRQLGVLDRHGGTAAWTGERNTPARGHRTGEGHVIVGNWLGSAAVLDAMDIAFRRGADEPRAALDERLLDVLAAGIDAGGDSRGIRSAALRVVRRDAPPLDLRVDYDEQPLTRLRELHARATSEPYAGSMRCVPTLDEPFRC